MDKVMNWDCERRHLEAVAADGPTEHKPGSVLAIRGSDAAEGNSELTWDSDSALWRTFTVSGLVGLVAELRELL